jgi:membrane-bound metal-dependent hydrolase YbcI (DUF457 family)
MAMFKSHLTVSALLGATYGGIGYAVGIAPIDCIIGGSLLVMAGLFPDVDGRSKSLQEISSILAVLLAVGITHNWHYPIEYTCLIGLGIYFVGRFGLVQCVRLTRHRGIFHSLLAAMTLTAIVYCITEHAAAYKSIGVLIGYITHLILDEFVSIDWMRFKFKRSAGTAFKLY